MTPTARSRFARFYRSRPLVGGALVVLSGIEIFLTTQLDLGRIHVQVGIEGFQSILIPIALVALGALLIADPAHRLFYGVITLAIAIYALIGVNLGGFVIGSILGIVGGVMGVSWMTPASAAAAADEDADTAAEADALAIDELFADEPASGAVEPAAAPAASLDTADASDPAEPSPLPVSSAAEPRPFAERPADTGRPATRRGVRTLAVAVVLGTTGIVAVAPAGAAQAASPLCTGILSILCPPDPASPTPSPSTSDPSATTAPSGDPTPPASADPTTPGATPAPAPTPTPSPSLPAGVPPSAAALLAPQSAATNVEVDASAPVVAAQTATLSASYLSQTNGRYVETVLLRHPDGSTVPALKILGDAGLLKDVRLHGSGNQHGAGIDANQLDVAGPIHFYAASFSGKAFGILPLHWDISSPPPPGIPMPPFTDVTVELVYFDAGGQTLTASHITPK